MDLIGTYKISFNTLRSVAIQCYALDVAAYPLLFDGTHDDKTGKTQSIYEELFTKQLLALAIALRTKFYQGLDYKNTASYISASGLLYKYKNHSEETIAFSFKDVCDKIIHADKVSRTLELAFLTLRRLYLVAMSISPLGSFQCRSRFLWKVFCLGFKT